MIRPVFIVFASVMGLLIALVAGLWVLLKTPAGAAIIDDITRPIIEREVQQRLNADIDYDEIIGPLPGQLVVRDIRLSTDEEIWFESDRLIVAWNPWALLTGELSIQRVVIDGSTLHRWPDLPDRTASPEPETPKTSRQGDILPFDIDLQALVIDEFVLAQDILGQEYRFSLQSELRVLKPRLQLTMHAETDQERDELFLTGEIDRQGADIDIVLVSEADGAISLASQADDRMELRLRIAGEYEDLQADVAAAMGQYGQLMATAARVPERNNALYTELTYMPGDVLPQDVRSIIGDELKLNGYVIEERSRADIELEKLAGAFGSLKGSIEGAWEDQQELMVDIDGFLETELFATWGAQDLGGDFRLIADIKDVQHGYQLNGQLNAGQLSITIDDAVSTDDVLLDGSIALAASSLTVAPEALGLLLNDGVNAAAKVTLTTNGALLVQNLRTVFGEQGRPRASANGMLNVNLGESTLDTELRIRLEPETLDQFLDQTESNGALSLQLTAQGAMDDLSLSLDGTVPSGRYRGNPVDAGLLRSTLTGLPFRPSGSLSLSSEGSYGMEAAISSTDQWVRIDEVDARFGALTLAASGEINRQTGEGSGSISVDAGTRSRIITGQLVSGQLSADVSHRASDGSVEVAVSADQLRVDDNAIGSLVISASGPREAVGFRITSEDVTAGELYLYGFATSGTVSIGSFQTVTIDDFIVQLSDDTREPQEISLVRPTTVRWGDGFSLAPTRIAWLNNGIVTANAALAQGAWVAQIAAQRIVVPGTDTFVSAQLNLDTSDTDPASFQVVAATEGKGDRYAIRADGRWTGEDVLTE
ncbi:MAG: hypothetical protein AAF225_04875, partial [Pseudomonadota bacterium]